MIAEIKRGVFEGKINAFSSKSAAHRSLICAALSGSDVMILSPQISDDITATMSAIKSLGSSITECDGSLLITPAKRDNKNITIDCNESGSTARFMLPVAAALGAQNVTFIGHGRLPERPFKILTDLLRENGVSCSSDTLPLTISGKLKSGVFELPGNISSQYISGLLLALSITEGQSRIVLTSKLESAAYVDMTLKELECFGADIKVLNNEYIIGGKPSLTATERTVEGDWSQAAFFLSAGAIGGDVTMFGLDQNSLQGDRKIAELLKRFGADVEIGSDYIKVKKSNLEGIDIDASQIPDLVPILAVTAAFAKGKTTIFGAERLRIKESDRIKETVSRLLAFGINATETKDGMVIFGGMPKSANITSAGDHRIVMAFSVLAAFCDGTTTIDGSEAINKSYPSFFKDYTKLGGNAKCHPQSER